MPQWRPAVGLCLVCFFGLVAATITSACGSAEPAVGQVTPIYSPKTGKLAELTADRDGDGRIDTWAEMDGAHLLSVKIDRHGTGRPDRWEYYEAGSPAAAGRPTNGAAFERGAVLSRAEEANGPDGTTVSRHEYYVSGVISRVEEDSDFDGRVDKWEFYEHGALVRMDLDLRGTGKADRRFVYRADGLLDHLEADRDGSGHFLPMAVDPPSSAAPPATKPKGGGQ
jgi:hypothetical protein